MYLAYTGFALFCWHENFCCFIVIAVGTLVEKARRAAFFTRMAFFGAGT
jgi:hypothetical protein